MVSLKEELDRKGGLSIIMQGHLGLKNIVYIADVSRMWRKLFPKSSIVNVISSSDCIFLNEDNEFKIREEYLTDRFISSAFDIIKKNCDKIIISSFQTPLPKMKSDSPGINNINLMIAAAKTGLEHSNSKYTLRIRNDLFFCDRNFVDFYEKKIKNPIKNKSIFKQRVLVSEIFTLNPLTISKMPFHYSDWFHFGLTEDIKKIWNSVDFYPFEYAVWYRHRHHSQNSNAVEKRFYTRFAPEQWVSFPFIKKQYPELILEYHNDTTSLIDSIFVLYDNFIILDMHEAHAYIEKYQSIINNMSNYTRVECFSQNTLENIVNFSQDEIKKLFVEGKYASPPRKKIMRLFYRRRLKKIWSSLNKKLP